MIKYFPLITAGAGDQGWSQAPICVNILMAV